MMNIGLKAGLYRKQTFQCVQWGSAALINCPTLFCLAFGFFLFLPNVLKAEFSGLVWSKKYHFTHYDRSLFISPPVTSYFQWVLLPANESNGSCLSGTDCCGDIVCYGLEYTPGVTGTVTSYTTGFFTDCLTGMTPVISNASCVMVDNSFAINECMESDSILFNSSGYDSLYVLSVFTGVPVILHQVCFSLSIGQSIVISEDPVTDLTLSIDLTGGGHVDEFPEFTSTLISRTVPSWPADVLELINCVNQAVPPVVPVILDFCGEVIQATLISTVDVPGSLTCEGTRIYTYEYSECSGITHLWTYTYSIEYLPFTTPADDEETVSCLSDVNVNLVTPPAVNDNCGIPLTPVGPSAPAYDPPVITCEGTVTYTWTYTDCEGNIGLWHYVFTIQPVDPSESGEPAPISSTIACGLEGTPPAMLPVVLDACDNVMMAPAPVVGGTYTGGCDGTITYTYTYSNCVGYEFVWVYTYTVSCSPVTIKVFLEGPYQIMGDSMLPDLNINHVLPGQDKLLSPSESVELSAPFTPFGQPYNTLPWNYNGNSGLGFGDPSAPGAPMGVIPYPLDVVDWILVTVRENGMDAMDNIWTCAGWIHTDGNVTFPEACGPLSFDIMDDYFILVQHRNHLGILTPFEANMPCGNAIIEWDFTAANSYEPIFRVGQKQMEPGIWAMHAANGEQIIAIAGIESNDRTTWRILQNALGYSVGDYNMDVSTNSNDETVWKVNQNKTSGIDFY